MEGRDPGGTTTLEHQGSNQSREESASARRTTGSSLRRGQYR